MYDYRSTDLAGAAYYAEIFADAYDPAEEPSWGEIQEDALLRGESLISGADRDDESRAVFEEVYGPVGAVADLPF